MATKIKGLVSKNKRRFVGHGFDLDLSCIFFTLVSEYCRCTLYKWRNKRSTNLTLVIPRILKILSLLKVYTTTTWSDILF